MFVAMSLAVSLLTVYQDFRTEDVGDAFEKLGRVAEYADQRLQAATLGKELPEPPKLLADQRGLQIVLAATLASQALVLAIVGIATGQSFTGLARILRLNRYSAGSIWRPGLAVIAAYTLVVAYSIAADAIGVDLLKPRSTVPTEITRDNLTLAIAAVVIAIGAPISEELFFRGFIFSGLLRLGFWPAALVSGLLFTLFHLDPGSVIPFGLIGILMAWLYWSRGTLWDSIVFHFLFNSTSFMLLVAGS